MPVNEKFSQAMQLHQAGELQNAAIIYQEILKEDPNHADARHLLGVFCFQTDQLDQAVELISSAISFEPSRAVYYSNLANVYEAQQKPELAIKALEDALDRDEGNEQLLMRLGEMHQNRESWSLSLEYFSKALEISPENPGLLCASGLSERGLKNIDKAEQLFRKALELDHGFIPAMYNLALINKTKGPQYFSEANNLIQKCLASEAENYLFYRVMGQLKFAMGDFKNAEEMHRKELEYMPLSLPAFYVLTEMECELSSEHIASLETILRDSTDLAEKSGVAFCLSRVDRKKGDEAGAMDHCIAANKFMRETFVYDVKDDLQMFEKIASFFSREKIESLPEISSKVRPIFILGMPRSGSTLAEQILSSHSQVYGAGELDNWYKILGLHLNQPQVLFDKITGMSKEEWEAAGKEYLEKLSLFNAPVVIDKLPYNFIFAGILARLFPDAVIINTVRNPLETCLSCFRSDFSIQHKYKYDLVELGRYFQGYQKLMDHWKTVSAGRIVDFSLEELRANPDSSIKSLLRVANLDFEESCNRFFENERSVITASALQVRKPVYDSQIKWHSYRDKISPLLDILGENP